MNKDISNVLPQKNSTTSTTSDDNNTPREHDISRQEREHQIEYDDFVEEEIDMDL